MLLLTIFDDIGIAIVKALRTLFMSLCDVVYRLIVVFYDIFEIIGTASLLSNDTVMRIYEKIGLILGLFMVFRVSFSIINYIINPELISDKQKGMGNIVKRIIVVIVLLGITPSLFREAYVFQNFLVRENIVGKILFEDNSSLDKDNGKNLAWFGFNSFYHINTELGSSFVTSLEDKENIKKGSEININTMYSLCPEMDDRDGQPSLVEQSFKQGNTFKYAYNCLNENIEVRNGANDQQLWIIEFDGWGLVCLIVGVLLLWMILMYTIQLGVRLLQLAYLQLVAPIPIIMYLDPKNNDSLSKWSKQCLTTFFDFFIRTGIMYFSIFIIQLLINNKTSFLDSFSGASALYVKIVMIIAVLIFAKRVPKLLEEVIPSLKNSASLDFGLKMPKEMKQVGGAIVGATAAGTIGLIGNGLNFKNKFNGFIGGVAKGAVSGFKGNKLKDITSTRAKQNITNRQNLQQGNSLSVKMGNKLRETFGFDSEGYADIRKMQNQWDDGKNIYERMSSKRISNLDASTSYSDFKKLDFHEEWVKALKDKDSANTVLKDKASKLTYTNAKGTAAEIKIAQKEYDDAQKVYETADRVKSAMDKKYSDDAQRYSNYKFYNKGRTPRPGTGTPNGGFQTGPTNGPRRETSNGGFRTGLTNGPESGTPNGGSGTGPTSDGSENADNGEQQANFSNVQGSILDNANFEKGFAGASEYLRKDARAESGVPEDNNLSKFRRAFRKGEDENLTAQAELIRERAEDEQKKQELEKARNAIRGGDVNQDAINDAANERYNAAVDKLNNNNNNN